MSVIAGDTAAEAADHAGRAAAEDSAQPHLPVHRQGEGFAGATGRFALVPPYHHLHKCAKSSKLIFCICSIPTEDHHQDIPRSLLDCPLSEALRVTSGSPGGVRPRSPVVPPSTRANFSVPAHFERSD